MAPDEKFRSADLSDYLDDKIERLHGWRLFASWAVAVVFGWLVLAGVLWTLTWLVGALVEWVR